MNITIPKSLEALVRRKVDEGHYSTEDEVVADALRLLQARDEVTAIKRARLQDAIDRGYDDIATGKVISLDSEDQIDGFFTDDKNPEGLIRESPTLRRTKGLSPTR